jgi:hypothetical protein
MESIKPAPIRAPSLLGDLFTLLPVAVAIVAFYAWTVGSNAPEPLVAGHQGDYYNLLVDGFVDGHLFLKAAVDPALLLPPAERPAGGGDYLLDASLYRGHYYLYFGVTPALTFFLPFRLLSGQELNQLVVVAIQGSAAFLAGLALLLVMRRQFAPAASRLSLVVAVVVWGFGSALPVTLRKPHMYEVAITAGLLWGTCSLLCTVLAVLRPAKAIRWLALASLSAGLAVGSRPNLLVGAAGLIGVLVWLVARARRPGVGPRPPLLGWAVAAIGPAAAIGAGLLLYNYERFGDALEFGHRYQMGSNAAGFFSARYFWHNLQLYYLTPPAGSWLFPFFFQGTEGPRPPGYIGVEQLHGQFFCALWILLLMLVAAVAGSRGVLRNPQRLAVLAVLGWWAGANFLLLAFTSVRADRYLLDFHPALVLGGCLIFLETAALPSRWLRRAAVVIGVAGAALIAFFNAGISVETMGRMRGVNPAGYARLERAVNRMVWPLFRMTRPHFGPRAFQVVFPPGPPGAFEPLITAGAPLNGTTLLVHYLEPGRAELLLGDELTSDNPIGGAKGPVFDTRPGQVRRLEVAMGPLLPPIGHPWFGSATLGEMQREATTVRVVLDGREVLRSSERPHAASPGQLRIGTRKPWASAGIDRFSGRLQELPEAPENPAEPVPSSAWGYRIEVQLPRDRFGGVEPLLTTGIRPEGDALLLRYRDKRSVELIHDQIGAGLVGSVILPIDYNQPQVFEVWFDPAAPVDGQPRYRLSIFHGGHPVLVEKTPLQPFAYGQEAIGANVVGSSVGLTSFGGTILAITRTDVANVSRRILSAHNESAAAVRFRLPSVPDALAQPLLVLTRADGRQGLLAMRQSGAGVQIGWRDAAGWWWSWLPAGSASDLHTVGVQWSLADGAAVAPTAGPANSLVAMIVVDDVICQHPRPEFFSGAIAQVSGWNNPWPADRGVEGHFSGAIEPPPALRMLSTRDAGPPRQRHFQLAVRFPSNRPGRNEPLLTAGKTRAADGLYVHFERPGWIRIGADHWGEGGPLSEPVPVVNDAYQILEVEFGVGGWARPDGGTIRVSLNGRSILSGSMGVFPVDPKDVVLGRNPIGLSTSDAEFTGDIFPIEKVDPIR